MAARSRSTATAPLQLAGPAALGGTVAFGNTGANRLAFGAAGYDSATLSNFRYGDTVDLGGLAYGAGLELNLQGSTLQVLKGTTTVASFTLQAPAGAPATAPGSSTSCRTGRAAR